MGLRWGTNEHYIGTPDGIVEARAIARRPESERWDATRVQAISATPWMMKTNKGAAEVPNVIFPPLEVQVPEPEAAVDPVVVPRKSRITKGDLDRHGRASTCAKCRAMLAGTYTTKGHDSVCRDRVEAKIEETEEGQKRIAQARERTDGYIAGNLPLPVAPAPDLAGDDSAVGSSPMDESEASANDQTPEKMKPHRQAATWLNSYSPWG